MTVATRKPFVNRLVPDIMTLAHTVPAGWDGVTGVIDVVGASGGMPAYARDIHACCVANSGNVYLVLVANFINLVVLKIDTTGAVSFVANLSPSITVNTAFRAGVIVTPNESALYLTLSPENSVRRLDLNTKTWSSITSVFGGGVRDICINRAGTHAWILGRHNVSDQIQYRPLTLSNDNLGTVRTNTGVAGFAHGIDIHTDDNVLVALVQTAADDTGSFRLVTYNISDDTHSNTAAFGTNVSTRGGFSDDSDNYYFWYASSVMCFSGWHAGAANSPGPAWVLGKPQDTAHVDGFGRSARLSNVKYLSRNHDLKVAVIAEQLADNSWVVRKVDTQTGFVSTILSPVDVTNLINNSQNPIWAAGKATIGGTVYVSAWFVPDGGSPDETNIVMNHAPIPAGETLKVNWVDHLGPGGKVYLKTPNYGVTVHVNRTERQ